MLKDNTAAFSDAGNMLFGSKYEELVANSLSSKNRSKGLFGFIKNQGSSKEGSKRQPFRKGRLFRSRENRGRWIFTASDQTLQQQYPIGEQGRDKNELVNSTFHQLDGPSVCISILQSTSTSNEFIAGENQATAQSRQSETFCKELAKTDHRSCDTGYSKRLQNPFYFAAKSIKATKFVLTNQRSIRPSGSGVPGHSEEGCYSSFGSQRGPSSQLFVSCEKERWGESPSSQPKEPEQKYSVSALQDGRVVSIKGNVVTRGQNVQDRPEGRILCYLPVSEIHKVCQIPVERPSIRAFLPLLRDFSSCSSFHKAIKSLYISLEKAHSKNSNIPRRHATNGIFIRGLVDGNRYTDIHTSTHGVSNQYQNVLPRANADFRISRGDSRFWGNDLELSQGKTPQSTESLRGNPRNRESNSQGTKQTDWEVIIHSNSSPSSTPPLFSSSISTDSEINLSEFFRGKCGNFDEGKERTVMMERKFKSFSPTTNNNKLRCIITRLGSELSRPDNRGAMFHGGTKVSYKCLGAQVSQISYNVLLTKRNRRNT